LFSRAEIRDIIGRASTIDERRAGICVVEEPEDETTREQVRDRLMAWRQLAAAGDSSLFARRLATEGLDERSARAWARRGWPTASHCRGGRAPSPGWRQ
jgi:hypothetical protein